MSSPAKVSFSPSKFVANSMCMVATCLNQLPYCGTRGTVLAKSGICVDNTVLQGVIKKGSNNRISNKMRPKTPFSCCRNRAKKVYTSSGGTAIGTLVIALLSSVNNAKHWFHRHFQIMVVSHAASG